MTPPGPGMPRMHRMDGWHYRLETYDGVVLLALLAVPLALVVIGVLARRRGTWRSAMADVGLVYGTLPSLWLTMLPGSQAGEVTGRTSFVPFHDMVTTGPVEIVGNLILLAALGFFAPIRWARAASLPRVVLLAGAVSATIETLQYVLRLDRVSSVDDVILNTAGAGLAALVSLPWWPSRRGTASASHDTRALPRLES